LVCWWQNFTFDDNLGRSDPPMNGCLPQSVRIFLLAALVGIANAFSAPASEIPSRAVNPSTYKSPSGADTLTVDPSDCYGRYDGAYRVAKNGKEQGVPLPSGRRSAVLLSIASGSGYRKEHC
jgi:hypothetical protein